MAPDSPDNSIPSDSVLRPLSSVLDSELRVFISSTFRDLQREREELIKKVFPEIRAVCRERGVEFTEIDLRWGVTEEQAHMGQVIRTCLEEIDRCRPYFIGIVGDRYGWVPGFNDVQKDVDLLRGFPWVEDLVAEEASITEIEFLYGASLVPAQTRGDASRRDGALFYVRRMPTMSGAPEEEQRRLASLVAQIRSSECPVQEFDTAEAFGEMVKRDMLELIERRWPVDRIPSSLEEERREHEAFASTRRRAYIPNPLYLKTFNRHLLPPPLEAEEEGSSLFTPLLISGVSGAGKSALIAYLSTSYRRRHPEAFVITHFVGASAESDHLGVIRHLIREIAERRGLDYPVASSPEDLVKEFPEWLAGAGGTRQQPVVLFIDALNQLEGSNRSLDWLPRYFPPGLQLVVSSAPGPTLDSLRERGWEELGIEPLTTSEREALIVRYFGEYRKSIGHHLVSRIANDPKASSPLFLRTLLEEARLFGEFDKLAEHVDHYLMSNDLDDLFRWVLERMERDFGADTMRQVMTLIAMSRDGLTETELLEITGLTRVALSTLIHALDYHLIRRSGQLNFFHDYLRHAVEQRYLRHVERRRDVHIRLADYFSSIEVTEHVVDELPWQLREAEEWDRLAECLTRVEIFRELATSEREYELLGYWLAIGDRHDIVEAHHKSVERYAQQESDPLRLAELLDQTGRFLLLGNHFAGAEPLLTRALELFTSVLGSDSPRVAQCTMQIGKLYHQEGQYEEAEPLLKEAFEVCRSVLGEDNIQTIEVLDAIGRLYYDRKEFDKAEEAFRRSLAIEERMFGLESREVISTLNDLGAALHAKGDNDGAEELWRRGLGVTERTYGDSHRLTAESLNNLGVLLLVAREDFDSAMEVFKRSLLIFERLVGPDHHDTAVTLLNMGVAMRRKGRYDTAEQFYRRALSIQEKILGSHHPSVAEILLTLGTVLRFVGRYREAEELFRRAAAIHEETSGPEHLNAAEAWLQVAVTMKESGSYTLAKEIYEQYLPIRERERGAGHPRVVQSIGDYIEVLRLLDQHEDANRHAQRLDEARAK